MGFFKKKEDVEELEPQYYNSAINVPVLNYKVYYMNNIEKIVYFLIAFIVGGAVGYLFYGGLGKDEYGNATTLTYICNVIVVIVTGCIAGKMYLPIRTTQIINKRHSNLNLQFRDMLDGLTTSLGAGNNVPDAFSNVYSDLKIQYEEDAFILKELEVILAGIRNSIDIEELLYDFGSRSGIQDGVSFADVFKVSYRKGGNIKDIIRDTHEVLSEKMAIREEIETMVASNKMETLMMVAMPIGLVGFIKLSSPEFASNFATLTGIIATTVAVLCFVGAYILSTKLLDIEI